MKWIIFGIPLYKLVIIVGFGFMAGFFSAALLAAAGRTSREMENRP